MFFNINEEYKLDIVLCTSSPERQRRGIRQPRLQRERSEDTEA